MLVDIIVFIISLLDSIVFALLYCFKGKKALARDFQGLGDKVLSVYVDDTIDPNYNPENETRPMRNPAHVGKKLSDDAHLTSMTDLLEQSIKKYSNKDFLGTRKLDKIEKNPNDPKQIIYHFKPMVWQTYAQVGERIKNIGKGIVKLTGLSAGDKFAIFDNTSQDWFMVAHAAMRNSITLVTVYATLGEDALIAALNETEVTAILTNEASLSKFERVSKEVPTLRYIIYTTEKELPETTYAQDLAAKTGCKVLTVPEVEQLGEQETAVEVAKAPTRSDLAIIMYTSGTTGKPKGVMITHGNIISAVAGVRDSCKLQVNDSNPLTYLAYLPLAHIFEFGAEHYIVVMGGKIGFGNSRTLADRSARPRGDLATVRPTFLTGVPRVYDTIKKGVNDLLHDSTKTPHLKRVLFEAAYKAKREALALKKDTPLWNALVFKNVRENLGGRVELIVSGGAALNKDTNEWLRICVGCPVIQGYGLTETCAGLTLQSQVDEYKTGTVGGIACCAEVKLISVPEMGYLAKNECGEIATRGPQVTLGYYKQEAITREAYKENGWFHTGDIGRRNPEDGSISVIDRRKNLVKLDTGEYVALEKLETIYGNSPFVVANGICCYADSNHSTIVALVIPNVKEIAAFAAENKITGQEMKELIGNKEVVKAVLKSFEEEAKKSNLSRIEYIANVKLVLDEWTPENELLTPSMKLQRSKLTKKYEAEIAKLYGK